MRLSCLDLYQTVQTTGIWSSAFAVCSYNMVDLIEQVAKHAKSLCLCLVQFLLIFPRLPGVGIYTRIGVPIG